MQQEILYRNWLSTASHPPENSDSGGDVVNDTKNLRKLVAENAVVVLARTGCCMCHVVKLLLHGHGVNPTILAVDERNEADVIGELSRIIGGDAAEPQQFPAVFVGGELFGGLEEVMAAHISGELVPKLRAARALWL